MDKLINSAFDFFAYALPGGFIILASLILNDRYDTFQDYLAFAQQLNLGSAAVLLVAGYLIGFALTPLGRRLYRRFHKKTPQAEGYFFRKMHKWLEGNLVKDGGYDFDDDNLPEQKMPISEKFILVRQFTPANFRHIESWHVYSLMSQNMAIANILVFVFVIIRFGIFVYNENWSWSWGCFWSWLLIMLGALFFTFLFLFNAVKFNIWSINEQNAAIKALLLREQAQKLGEQENATRQQP